MQELLLVWTECVLSGMSIKDQCNIQCDDIDSYEYAVECPDYVKENEDENCKR